MQRSWEILPVSRKSVFASMLAVIAVAFAWISSPQAAPISSGAFATQADSLVQTAAAHKKIKAKIKSIFKKKKKKVVAKKAPKKRSKPRRRSMAGRCGTFKYWDRKKGECIDARS
jgi:hypothetical protein